MDEKYISRRFTDSFGHTRYAAFKRNPQGVWIRVNNRSWKTEASAKKQAVELNEWDSRYLVGDETT